MKSNNDLAGELDFAKRDLTGWITADLIEDTAEGGTWARDFRRMFDAAAAAHVINRLIAALHDVSSFNRLDATRTLIAMGGEILLPLQYAIIYSDEPAFQIAAAKILGKVAATASNRRRAQVGVALEVARDCTKNSEVVAAINTTLADLGLEKDDAKTAAIAAAGKKLIAQLGLEESDANTAA